jgi:broad specificity phosphatase PhoE
VRHGATAWNAAGRFQGQSDVGLSPEGRDQARAIALHLSAEGIDRIYASDLERSYETARTLAAPHGLGVIADPRLREFAFGDWEGLTWAEIVAARPHLGVADLTDASRYRPEGGETFADVTARVRAFVGDLRARDDRGHVVVVTHAGPLHAMLDVLGVVATENAEGHSVRSIFLPASLTRVTMEADGARLITLSNVRHLHSTS